MFAGLDVIWGEHCFSVFVVSAFLSVNTCVLLPFPVRWQTRDWATLCAPAQVSPAPPAPSSTRPPPPTPTERSTGGRKARATSRPTVCRAPRKVRSPVESLRFGKLACVFQTCALTPPGDREGTVTQAPAHAFCLHGGTSGYLRTCPSPAGPRDHSARSAVLPAGSCRLLVAMPVPPPGAWAASAQVQ